MTTELVKWAYPCTVALVFCFGLGACIFSFIRERRQGFRDNIEFFLTARNSVGTLFIAWSYYASAMGSWALFSVPSYSYIAGAQLTAPWQRCILRSEQACYGVTNIGIEQGAYILLL